MAALHFNASCGYVLYMKGGAVDGISVHGSLVLLRFSEQADKKLTKPSSVSGFRCIFAKPTRREIVVNDSMSPLSWVGFYPCWGCSTVIS